MSEGLHPEQIKVLRKMTPAQRLQMGMQLIEEMRELRAGMLRLEHPEWTREQVRRALRDFVLHGRS
ncbi:MAG: hypothetical protein ACREF8_00910 [Chthoniobacterales bacterium]